MTKKRPNILIPFFITLLIAALTVVGPVMLEHINKADLFQKKEISASDYDNVGQLVKDDTSLQPLVKKYINNDGIIDEDEYYDIMKSFNDHYDEQKKQEAVGKRQELKDQLNQAQ